MSLNLGLGFSEFNLRMDRSPEEGISEFHDFIFDVGRLVLYQQGKHFQPAPKAAKILLALTVVFSIYVCSVFSQSSTGTISGTVTDENNAVIAGATVTVRNVATAYTRSTITNSDGHYRLDVLPSGNYEVKVEAANFSKQVHTGITLATDQYAIVNAPLKPGTIEETVTVNENASMMNSTTPEVGTRFDGRRVAEIPTAVNRSVYAVLFSAAGVSQPAPGQNSLSIGVSLSVNGGRLRSNSFLLDGQDLNEPTLTGTQIALNNPDAIQEVRIITNQFLPEHGHNAGSVTNIIGKSGTNDFHGSAFWFHNNESLNACNNLDKVAGFCDRDATDGDKKSAPQRFENQIGFTLGGPVFFPRFGEGGSPFVNGRDKTFFFTDYQHWSDRRSSSYFFTGAPTAAGRQALQGLATPERPQVQKLLQFLPAANGSSSVAPAVVVLPNEQAIPIELGTLAGTSPVKFDSSQGSFRIDHTINERNLIYGRYRYNYESTSGTGQIIPAGHNALSDLNAHAAAFVWTSVLTSNVSNEARFAWKRFDLNRDGIDPLSKTIPTIQITELGMIGGAENERRTAFGIATNLPVIRISDTFQITDAISVVTRKHTFKFGGEWRRTYEWDDLFSLERGNLTYANLSDFVNDRAQSGGKTLSLPGGDSIQRYRWNELYAYAQDQWRLSPTFTLSYGIRYEYPGDSFSYLRDLNGRILAAHNYHAAYHYSFPKSDLDNFMPRVGFAWNPKTSHKGVVGFVTGGTKLVLRGGYARTYDTTYINIHQNIFGIFPFAATQNLGGAPIQNAYRRLVNISVPTITNPWTVNRSAIAPDFRAPATDQFSFDIQRELSADLMVRIAYIRTRGTALLQNMDANPRVPCPFGTGPGTCNTTGINRITGTPTNQPPPPLVDSSRGPINLRTNSGSSTYDSLQASLEKRLSQGLSFGVHYTWSSFIDAGSDAAGTSVADNAFPQDPYDRKAERARSSYDRPHRLTGNIVYELPFFDKQSGLTGTLLGGWQVNSFFNIQSGAPMSVFNGSDPAGVHILMGGTVRPNVFTHLDVSSMSIAELYLINQALIRQAHEQAQAILDMNLGPCVAGWLGGPPLPYTLFSAPRARVTCGPTGRRNLTIEFNGIPEGQRVGNAGRNILRADSLKLVDIGIIKNTKITESVKGQFWIDFFNAFNWRNFGIPSGIASSPDFLNQWATDGGNRRIRFGVRLVF
jgi:hypothetical protein